MKSTVVHETFYEVRKIYCEKMNDLIYKIAFTAIKPCQSCEHACEHYDGIE